MVSSPLRAFAALLPFSFLPALHAQEVFGAPDLRPEPEAKPAWVPHSRRAGLDLTGSVPEVVLPPLDTARLVAEDERDAGRGEKVLRYGIGRDLYVDAAYGRVHVLPDGWLLWTIDIVSQGAMGLRLHFVDVDLPKEAELACYAVASPTTLPEAEGIVAGPWRERGLLGSGEFWSPTRDGERVRVELAVPVLAGDVLINGTPLRIDAVQHIYRDPVKQKGLDGGTSGAGTCHNDVACYSSWANVANAVAGIGVVNSNSLYCTGQLLNAQNSDQTPYWLTANHCLSSQSSASSAEIYWRYQRSSCAGTVPSLSSVPQSAVATLLSTGSSSDYTLLMIEGTLPTGLFWAGWTSTAVANGTDSACVHHPSGDYKRISFGEKSSTTGCGGSNHVRVDWSDGPTEPGSSGSGIFRVDTQQLFGQLHCGPSACGNETNDDYGAFSATYPNISSFLTAGSDDASEPNDSCATAPATAAGTYSNRIVKSTDEDWYRVSIASGASFSATLDFTHAFGDVDCQLYSSCGGTVVAAATSGTDDEVLNFVNAGAAADFFLRVYLAADTRNQYSLTLAGGGGGGGPVNDLCANATVVGNGVHNGTLVGATNDGSASCGNSNANGDVWYAYTAPCTGDFLATTCGTHDAPGQDSGTDTVLAVYSACGGTQLACNDDAPTALTCGTLDNGVDRDSAISLAVTAGQTLRIRVSHWNTSAPGPFVLRLSCAGSGPANDLCSAAQVIGDGNHVGSLVGATNDGGASCGSSLTNVDVWYAYTAASAGTLRLDTCGTHDTGGLDAGTDTVISVHSSCPGTGVNEIACNDDAPVGLSCGSLDGGLIRDSALELPVTAGQTLLVRVSHFGSTTPGSFVLRVLNTPDPGSPFVQACFGDGGDQLGCTNCPCGNNAPLGAGGGCLNSNLASPGARLVASGSPDVTTPADTLHFDVLGANTSTFGILVSGTVQLPNNMANPCFAQNPGSGVISPGILDGLRCVGGTVVRHGSRSSNTAGDIGITTNGWGPPNNPLTGLGVSSGYLAGQTRHFQVFYREAAGAVCASGQNTTQAVAVTFF